MERRRFIALLALGTTSVPPLFAADQTGAEKTKRPVHANVVGPTTSVYGEGVGNIEVVYKDGTKDRWTTNSDCGLPQVASDGAVGWVVYNPPVSGANGLKNGPSCRSVTICRQGRVLCRVRTDLPYLEEWRFLEEGKHFATKSRAAHGPATLELFETGTGKRLEQVKAYETKLPSWAEPWRE